MGMYTARSWACDRCGTKDETSLEKQPVGWHAALLWYPPLRNPNEKTGDDTSKIFCRLCTRDIREALNGSTHQGTADA